MKHRTKRGAWTSYQFKALGLKGRPVTGWIEKIIGKELNAVQAMKFETGNEIFKASKGKKATQKSYSALESKILNLEAQMKELTDTVDELYLKAHEINNIY